MRSGRDDPSVEKSTRQLEASGREIKIKTSMKNAGTAEPGGLGGASAPPKIILENFFPIEKLLLCCFHRYAIINEDYRP